MKKYLQLTFLLITLTFLTIFQVSHAQVVLYEDFNYTPPAYIGGNGNAGTSSNNWTTHSVTAGQTTTVDVISGNLTYPGLFPPNGYKVSDYGNANLTSRDINRAFTSASTVLYFSVLLNVVDNSDLTVTGDYFMHFGATSGAAVTIFGGRLGAKSVNAGVNYRFIIQNTSSGTPTFTEFAQDLNFGTTYLVVVKYDRSASPTVASLWVNPSSLGGAEPTGSVTNSSGTGTFATFASICIRNNATTPKLEVDEIRVGPNWADVTPLGATPSLSPSVSTLSGFQYTVGLGPSASQNYTISGSNLNPSSGNITVTGTTHYEVSLNNATFSGFVTIPYSGYALSATTVYVRLVAGLPLGNYNGENIVNSGGGATAVNVACSGSVVKAEPTNYPTGFAAALGVPTYSTINTTWTDAIGATIPDGYLVKGATGGYASIVDPVDGTPEADGTLVKNILPALQTAAFTGLVDNTQYYFKIYPYTNSGTFINYKTSVTVPTATATTTLSPSITYTWQGASGGDWTVATNWTPTRNTPAINDILIFTGGGTKTIINVPTQTVGKMVFSANTTINLQSSVAVTLSVYGVTGTDLDIPAGCALNLNAANAITIALLTTATASISGNMTFSSTVATAHRLTGADANSITFNSGAIFTAGTFFSGNAFGTGTANSVIFANGSTYIHQAGSNPFVNNPPNSICVFQTGSLYKLTSNLTPSFSGKTYANFEMDATGSTVTTTGGAAVMMDNLTVTNGTLNFNMTGTPGHSIKGNISVAVGGTLNFAPASVGTVSLNGTSSQSISGAGIIASTANSTLEILNATGVILNTSNVTLNGNLKLTTGLFTLGSNNLLLGTTGAITGTPSATSMVVASGSGQLQKGFPSGFTGNFAFPVGDNTGTAEYSPVTLNFTGGTFGTGNYAGVNLVNSKYAADPNNTNYLKRYWNISQSGITGFAYNATFQYVIADIVGTESLIYCLRVLPTPFGTYDIANTTLHQLTATGLIDVGTFTGSQPQTPSITTSTVINITYNSATGGGNVLSDGGTTITARGVCWATTPNPTLAGLHTTEPGTTGIFTSNISGLAAQTTYYVRAYATNMVGTVYGTQVSFTTLCEPYPPQVDFYADHTNIMVGDSINFFDLSLYCPTYRKWSFVGGLPYESYAQNPTWIHYNYPGTYTVCLDESNGYGFVTNCKTAYITVTTPPAPINAKIVITEIMYNPPETGVDSIEFIELYNNDTAAINLQNFYFSNGPVFTFPSLIMQGYSYLLVARYPNAIMNTFGVSSIQWTSGALNNGGEAIAIHDRMGALVDSVNFDDAPPWDTLADGRGPSLELCDPNSNNNNGANWRHAIEFANKNQAGDSIWASPLAGCSNPPVASFTANDTTIIQYQTVTFTDHSSSNTTGWIWTFEGGSPGTFNGKTPPPILYPDMGSFDVTLKTTNIAGQNTLVKSNYIQVGYSGLPGTKGQIGLTIYPNPNKGAFNLVFDGELPGQIKIFDQLGNVVFEKELVQHTSSLNLPGLLPGLYFVQVTETQTGIIKSIKLIIQ